MRLSHKIFQLLLLTIPVQLNYYFWPQWAYVWGLRVDYLSPTVYATDILLILLLVVWILERPPRFIRKPLIVLFLVFAIANLSVAANVWLSLYYWIRMGFLICLVRFIAIENPPLSIVRLPLTIALVATVILAVTQIVFDGSVGGLLYWAGERNFRLSTPGISTFTLLGREILRPYATFPHPNALAGFSLLALILIAVRRDRLFSIALFAAGILLLITASRNALIGAVFAGVSGVITPRLVRKVAPSAIVLFVAVSLLLPLVAVSIPTISLYPQSVANRLTLAAAAGFVISDNPFLGVGLGGFIHSLPEAFRNFNAGGFWWLQPVHNTPLLIAAETGLAGLGLLVAVLLYLVTGRTTSAPNIKILLVGLVVVLWTSLLDHYWITIHQNRLLLAVLLGYLAAIPDTIKNQNGYS